MLGRGRMRRGVSLEVIVEEDDSADVLLDPTPIMENDDEGHDEDDDDDDEEEGDDDDDDNENGSSTPGSPNGSGGEVEGAKGGGGIGGGGRSDRGGGRPSGAEERRKRRERRKTIGGLSRMRSVSCEALTLLDTSDMDSCCSEWDDDDDLSTGSANYVTLNRPISRRRILESSQSQCDSEDSGIEYHSNEDDPGLEDQSSAEDRRDADESSSSVDIHEQETATESDGDDDDDDDGGGDDDVVSVEPQRDEATPPSPADADADAESADAEAGAIADDAAAGEEDADGDVLLSAKNGKHLFEERSRQEQTTQTTAAKYLQEYTGSEVLENDKLVIVETTPPVPTRRTAAAEGVVDAAEEEMQLKRAAYTIRNKEVQLEELPRPHTVRSVKQLFEDLKTPVGHFHAWRDLGRFRDIKSNPSSKILRFDRSDSSEAAACGSAAAAAGSSSTLPNPTRQPLRASPRTFGSLTLPKSCPSSGRAPAEGPQSVMLRRPTVRGFNVKKALMEDPRTFRGNARRGQAAPTAPRNEPTAGHHSRKGHAHFARRSHHLSDATADRSDTESLASDVSEDSGVSNDSSASGPVSAYRAFDAYASDPSFKWIDPAIMAKIRSVGTTVIFFGPRPRPRHQDGSLPRAAKATPSGLKVLSKGGGASGIPASGRSSSFSSYSSSNTTIIRPAQKDVSRSSPVPAPRIVGVLRKRNPNLQPTPTVTPTESRASTPGISCQ